MAMTKYACFLTKQAVRKEPLFSVSVLKSAAQTAAGRTATSVLSWLTVVKHTWPLGDMKLERRGQGESLNSLLKGVLFNRFWGEYCSLAVRTARALVS